jgi:hypothetical protein
MGTQGKLGGDMKKGKHSRRTPRRVRLNRTLTVLLFAVFAGIEELSYDPNSMGRSIGWALLFLYVGFIVKESILDKVCGKKGN